MSDNVIDKVVELILQRKIQVLKANGILPNSQDPKDLWINGIYDDIIEYIKSN